MSREFEGSIPAPKTPSYQPSERTTPELEADRHRIPEASRNHPLVQEFTHIAADLDTLIDATSRAETNHDRPVKGTSLTTQRELLGAQDMRLPLEVRYAVANSLLLAADAFLSEGIEADSFDTTHYGFRKLRDAMNRLGYDLQLTKRPPTVFDFDHDDPTPELPEPPAPRLPVVPEVDIDE